MQYRLLFYDFTNFLEMVNKALLLEDKHHAIKDIRKRKKPALGISGTTTPMFSNHHCKSMLPHNFLEPQHLHPNPEMTDLMRLLGSSWNNVYTLSTIR